MTPFTICVYNTTDTIVVLHVSGHDIDSVFGMNISQIRRNEDVVKALKTGSLMVTVTNEKDTTETMTQLLT